MAEPASTWRKHDPNDGDCLCDGCVAFLLGVVRDYVRLAPLPVDTEDTTTDA